MAFRQEGPFTPNRFAVSPDDEWIVFGMSPAPVSELWLVEIFQ